jgi:hypothetical protein
MVLCFSGAVVLPFATSDEGSEPLLSGLETKADSFWEGLTSDTL